MSVAKGVVNASSLSHLLKNRFKSLGHIWSVDSAASLVLEVVRDRLCLSPDFLDIALLKLFLQLHLEVLFASLHLKFKITLYNCSQFLDLEALPMLQALQFCGNPQLVVGEAPYLVCAYRS